MAAGTDGKCDDAVAVVKGHRSRADKIVPSDATKDRGILFVAHQTRHQTQAQTLQ